MPAPRESSTTIAWALGVAALAVGCGKQQAGTAAPSLPPDDIDAIESRIAANAEDLRAAGIASRLEAVESPAGAGADGAAAVPGASEDGEMDIAEPTEPASGSTDATKQTVVSARDAPAREKRSAKKASSRCDRICDLAGSTCELADRVCDLARGHEGDPRYAQACTRATAQCEAARAACDECS